MKNKLTELICTRILVIIFPIAVSADSSGPNEWDQYRMKSDKNSVFNNGSGSLDSQTFKTNDEVRATPVVAGSKLFVGSYNTGGLFAFNVRTNICFM